MPESIVKESSLSNHSHSSSSQVLYPPSTHRAHPLHNTWIKVLASLLPHLYVPSGYEAAHPAIGTPDAAPSNSTEAFPLYHYLNHPLPYIAICGVAVGLEYKDYIHGWVLDVDDGSGEVVQMLCRKAQEGPGVVFGRRNRSGNQTIGTDGEIRGRMAAPGELISPPVPEWRATGWIGATAIDMRNAEVGNVLKVQGRFSRWKTTPQILVEKLDVIRDTTTEVEYWKRTSDTWKSVLCKPWSLSNKELKRMQQEDEAKTRVKEKKERKRRKKEEKQRKREEKERRRAQKRLHEAENGEGANVQSKRTENEEHEKLDEIAPKVRDHAVILSQTKDESALTSFQKLRDGTPDERLSNGELRDANGLVSRSIAIHRPAIQDEPRPSVVSIYTLDWDSLDLSSTFRTQGGSSAKKLLSSEQNQQSSTSSCAGVSLAPCVVRNSARTLIPNDKPTIVDNYTLHSWSNIDIQGEISQIRPSKQVHGEEWVKIQNEIKSANEVCNGPIKENVYDDELEIKDEKRVKQMSWKEEWESVNF